MPSTPWVNEPTAEEPPDYVPVPHVLDVISATMEKLQAERNEAFHTASLCNARVQSLDMTLERLKKAHGVIDVGLSHR